MSNDFHNRINDVTMGHLDITEGVYEKKNALEVKLLWIAFLKSYYTLSL